MLLYNVCYLAHTQSVEIPLSQAGDALGNLWAVCCSGELGRCVNLAYLSLSFHFVSISRSHETTPHLPPPTPSTFPLDFAQVLQATTTSPTRARRRVAVVKAGVVRDNDAEGSTSGIRSLTRRLPEQIAEEEGWEVVAEDGADGGFG